MQEETDDIISRDINRTFPEHPQFGFEQGQQALFRVLKAYSLHDLEVPSSPFHETAVTAIQVHTQPEAYDCACILTIMVRRIASRR